MKGDFTRDTFDSRKHYNSVRMQQGRVQLDADWNEQLTIQSYLDRTTRVDVIGLCGVPMHHSGFRIDVTPDDKDLTIEPGRIYVDGILCELEATPILVESIDGSKMVVEKLTLDGAPLEEGQWVELFSDDPLLSDLFQIMDINPDTGTVTVHESLDTFTDVEQPQLRRRVTYETQYDYSHPLGFDESEGRYLVYLDVWERHITALEDPEIREVALGGPDTATRTKTIWQVKLYETDEGVGCRRFSGDWVPEGLESTGKLAARAEPDDTSDEPCIVPPEAGYRRLENQLYRVEIHEGGQGGEATFKWSRENGSVVSKWESQDGNELGVSSTGPDEMLDFDAGDWVEITDDTRELRGEPGILTQLENVKNQTLVIDSATTVDRNDFPRNPKIRRWESENALTVPEDGDIWLDLEDGVQVKFDPDGMYQTGDYWLIPARTNTGDVIWPVDEVSGLPLFEGKHGIDHHYCPLALVSIFESEGGLLWEPGVDCRREFPPLTELPEGGQPARQLSHFYYVSGDGQEAPPGEKLPRPLQVGVALDQIPVAGAQVQFAIKEGNGQLHKTDGSGETGTMLAVKTGSDGVAECEWVLGREQSSQWVEARLFDEGGQTVHLPIRFNATHRVDEEKQEAGIHIDEVNLPANGQNLENDSKVPAAFLSKGISVVCDDVINPESINIEVQGDDRAITSNPVCYVTLDLPFPLQRSEQNFWLGDGQEIVGYQPIKLNGVVAVEGGNVIHWQPTSDTLAWLNGELFSVLMENANIDLVQARLTLKGNYIWGRLEDDSLLYLDGESYGQPAGQRTGIDFSSGNGQRGGDFEMWFWLTPEG